METVAFGAGLVRPAGWSPRFAAGWISGGDIFQQSGASHDFTGGVFLALGLDKQVSSGQGARPAVDLSFGLSSAWGETEERQTKAKADYTATDFRVGVRATWPVGQRLYPYTAVRVFGGPVNWTWDDESVSGSDANHYQLAFGLAASLGRVALQVEWGAAGEESLSVGVSSLW